MYYNYQGIVRHFSEISVPEFRSKISNQIKTKISNKVISRSSSFHLSCAIFCLGDILISVKKSLAISMLLTDVGEKMIEVLNC